MINGIKWIPLGPCACGLEIFASDEASGIIAVIHAEPRCKKFDELEPDKFLTYVRRSRGIPDAALYAEDKITNIFVLPIINTK